MTLHEETDIETLGRVPDDVDDEDDDVMEQVADELESLSWSLDRVGAALDDGDTDHAAFEMYEASHQLRNVVELLDDDDR